MTTNFGSGETLATPPTWPVRSSRSYFSPQESCNRGSFHKGPHSVSLWTGLHWKRSHLAGVSLGERRTRGKDQRQLCFRSTPSSRSIFVPKLPQLPASRFQQCRHRWEIFPDRSSSKTTGTRKGACCIALSRSERIVHVSHSWFCFRHCSIPQDPI